MRLSRTARLTGRYGKKFPATALRIVIKIEYAAGCRRSSRNEFAFRSGRLADEETVEVEFYTALKLAYDDLPPSAKRITASTTCSTSGIIASTSGGLCGGGIGCAAMRTTGPFKSENKFS